MNVVDAPTMQAKPAADHHVVGGRANPDFAYKPQLDGLRSVAVLAVIFYHGQATWMKGGYLGVDLFFVLSGYLITTLMLIERDKTGGVNLRGFWLRRAKRLLPASILMVAGTVVYARFGSDAINLGDLRGDALATMGYVANWWYIANDASYFEQFAAPSLLKHTWSLAIEEQFYLVWPLVIGLGTRAIGRGRQAWLLLLTGLAVLSAIWMVVLYESGADVSRVYYGTDTRLQALIIGACAAFLLHRRAPVLGATAVNAISGAATVGIVTMFIVASDQAEWMYRGGFTLFAVLAAIVIGSAVRQPGSAVARAAALGPLPLIGRVSYGMYLWHWPVYVVLGERTELSGIPLIAVDLVITSALVAASYNLLEMPVRRGVLRPRRNQLMALASVAIVLGLVISSSGTAKTDVEFAILGDGDIDMTNDHGGLNPPIAVLDPGEVSVMLVGDSIAVGLGANFTDGTAPVYLWNAGRIGCGVVAGEPQSSSKAISRDKYRCENVRDVWTDVLALHRPQVVLMLAGGHEVFDRLVGGTTLVFGTPEHREFMLEEMDKNVELLTAGGARLALLTTPCFNQVHARGLSAFGEVLAERTSAQAYRIDYLNELWAEVADEHKDKVTLIDLNAAVCPSGEYDESVQGVKLHVDGVHFTREAVQMIWPWLGPQLVAAAP